VNRKVAPIFIIFLAVLFSFNTLSFDFTFDDYIHIVRNEQVTNERISVSDIFSSATFPGNIYRPLLITSYKITHSLFGLEPYYYHLTNILLHAANTFLIYFLLIPILPFQIVFWSCALFAVHPIHSEAIANISGRSELLCHFFGLLAANWILSSPKLELVKLSKLSFHISISVFLLLAALLTKESGLVYFLLIPFLAYFQNKDLRLCLRILIPSFLLVALIYIPLRIYNVPDFLGAQISADILDNPMIHQSTFWRVLNALALQTDYIKLTLFPMVLSSDYSFAKLLPFNELSIVSSIKIALPILLILTAFYSTFDSTFYLARTKNVLSFSIFWFFIGFLVSSNLFFTTGTIFAERLAYLPSLGITIALSIFCLNIPVRVLSHFILVILLLGYAAKSYTQNDIWRNNETLFSYEAITSPQSAKAQFNYGMMLSRKNRLPEAKDHINKALAIYPNFADGWYGLSEVARFEGDSAGQLSHLAKALSINPSHPAARSSFERLKLSTNKQPPKAE